MYVPDVSPYRLAGPGFSPGALSPAYGRGPGYVRPSPGTMTFGAWSQSPINVYGSQQPGFRINALGATNPDGTPTGGFWNWSDSWKPYAVVGAGIALVAGIGIFLIVK